MCAVFNVSSSASFGVFVKLVLQAFWGCGCCTEGRNKLAQQANT